MLKLNNVSKRFGGRTVISEATFVVNRGDVAGIVGPNGSGKTTLLRIIAGEERPDSGAVDAGGRIAYVRQGFAADATRAVADVFPHAFAALSGVDRLTAISARIADTGDPAQQQLLATEYEAALAAISSGTESRIDDARRALDLRDVAPDERTGALSGGEQTKLALIDALATAPGILLLDEPTNNLDLDALAWLDDLLDSFAGPVLLVSHDRMLLDQHASQIIELTGAQPAAGATGAVETFSGNYTAYAAEKARRQDELWARFRRQQERERRMAREVRAIRQTAQTREHISQNDYYRGRNKKLARRAVVLARRLEREVAAEDHVEKPVARQYTVKAGMGDVARSGDRMLLAEDLAVTAGGRRLLDHAAIEIGWRERIVVTGPNGSGKTSLLRALIGETGPERGAISLSPSTRIGYLPQNETQDAADAGRTPVDVIRAASPLSETDARRFLHRFLFAGDDALTPVARLSYGERRRLALARIVLSGANLLVLDEPTNHLDIPSREAFESALNEYQGAILAVTHDRYFIEQFADRMLALEDRRLSTIMHARD